MMKYKRTVTYELEKYPEKCKECPCFSQKPYTDYSYHGLEACCDLGYMNNRDTRDFKGNIKVPGCDIENDSRVKLMS